MGPLCTSIETWYVMSKKVLVDLSGSEMSINKEV